MITSLFVDSFPKCQEAAVPFLCRYYFPLSDCSSGYIYSASREDCITITTTVCSVPWTLATNLGYGDQLPNCQELPPADNMSNLVDGMSSVFIEPTSSNITCLDDFLEINSTCIPRCDRFQQDFQLKSKLRVTTEIVASYVAMLASITVLIILAAKKGKQM